MACMAKCDQKECFAHHRGKCRCLANNNFGGRHCPFKRTDITWEEQERDCEVYADSRKGGGE